MKVFQEYAEAITVDQSVISIKQVYEWVKTGHWNLAQFTK